MGSSGLYVFIHMKSGSVLVEHVVIPNDDVSSFSFLH